MLLPLLLVFTQLYLSPSLAFEHFIDLPISFYSQNNFTRSHRGKEMFINFYIILWGGVRVAVMLRCRSFKRFACCFQPLAMQCKQFWNSFFHCCFEYKIFENKIKLKEIEIFIWKSCKFMLQMLSVFVQKRWTSQILWIS